MSESEQEIAPIEADVVEPEPEKEPDWKAEAEKWKSLSRKNEDAAKANAAKAKEHDSYLASQKTEQEKADEARNALQQERDEAKADLAIARSAVKHGLSESDMELIGRHGTPEEIESRAEKLAARLKVQSGKPDPHLGRETKPQGSGTGDWLRDQFNKS